MKTIFKFLIYAFLVIINISNTFAFDLKKLQENLNKLTNQNNSSDGENPFGNLINKMQGLAKEMSDNIESSNTVGLTPKISQRSTKQSTDKIKLAKTICEPNIPKLAKNLPRPNITNLEKDFGKPQSEIKKILNSIPNGVNDPIIPSLKIFAGAFETKEIEQLYNNFISKKDLESLSQLKELSLLKPGFNSDKKQIKADANFAYGIIHYFYSNSGGNKNIGIQHIKNGTGTPDNIGSLVVYGAWQFYGKNVSQNIMNGNKMALDGYNRAYDKNLKVNISQHKFQGMEKFTFGEKLFLEIAADVRNPYKAQYQNQLNQAAQIQKNIDLELARSENYDRKSGWYPLIIEQQNRQHELFDLLGENFGIATDLSDLKAKYLVLKSKVNNDNKLLERMVMINKQMAEKLLRALKQKKIIDQIGKENLANLQYNNEIMIMQNHKIGLSMVLSVFSGGGLGGAGFSEITKIGDVLGMYQNVACDVYSGIKSYAQRTNVKLKNPPKNPKAKFTTKFGKR